MTKKRLSNGRVIIYRIKQSAFGQSTTRWSTDGGVCQPLSIATGFLQRHQSSTSVSLFPHCTIATERYSRAQQHSFQQRFYRSNGADLKPERQHI